MRPRLGVRWGISYLRGLLMVPPYYDSRDRQTLICYGETATWRCLYEKCPVELIIDGIKTNIDLQHPHQYE